jgi:hypothetical protein
MPQGQGIFRVGSGMSHFDHPLSDRAVRSDLHVCSVCRRPFVVPMAIVDAYRDGRFLVELGCNNCGASSLDVQDDERLEELDLELDRTMLQMQDALDGLVLADELERIDRFAAALHDDLILPEDF